MEFCILFGGVIMCNFLSWDSIGILMFFFVLVEGSKLWEWGLFMMNWKFGGDLMSLLLLIMSLWIFGLVFLSSKGEEGSNMSSEYKFLLLLILFFLFSSFLFIDLLLFYVSFELVLIPMFVFVVMFGYQPERLLSGVFMLLYTVFGSLPLLLGLVWLKNIEGSLNYYYLLSIKGGEIKVWCLLLSVAFTVKLPLYGVHVWLPKAHVEAPVVGSMILAGLLLKLGGYGLMRMLFLLNLGFGLQSFFLMSGIWGGFICGFICLRQLDLKKLIAYSSVTHMGLFMGGLSSSSVSGLYGGMVMMVGHGLCSSGLFYMVGILYSRFFSRSILLLKGVMVFYPSLMMWNFFLNLGNMAAPPFLNIFGEIMLGIGMINWNWWVGGLLLMMFFITVFYSIYLFSFLSHGSYKNKGGNIIMVNEYSIIMLHLTPLISMLFKLEMFIWV